MTRSPFPFASLAFATAIIAAPVVAAPAIGQPAPVLKAVDADGRVRTLSEFKGRTVVLEWSNNGCPYVQKHYNAGSMQTLQKSATANGIAWLTVVSSAPGHQGHLTGAEARAWKVKAGAHSSAVLLDPTGVNGRAYDAKTTPHMFIIDKAGKVAYMGGIDDKPSSDPATLADARNHVAAALADLGAGRAVATPVTRPYGCSVKYGSPG